MPSNHHQQQHCYHNDDQADHPRCVTTKNFFVIRLASFLLSHLAQTQRHTFFAAGETIESRSQKSIIRLSVVDGMGENCAYTLSRARLHAEYLCSVFFLLLSLAAMSWFRTEKKREEKCFWVCYVFLYLSLVFSLRYKTTVCIVPHQCFFSFLSQITSCIMKSAECTNDSIIGRQPQPRSSGRRSSFTAVVRRSNPLRQNLSSLGKNLQQTRVIDIFLFSRRDGQILSSVRCDGRGNHVTFTIARHADRRYIPSKKGQRTID